MRKLFGMFILLTFLAIYILAVVSLGARIAESHWAINLVFYSIAGVAWAFPLKPLMLWMHANDKPLPSSEL
ncbi:MAG: hypothetical protein CME88_06120 [Hirschia sp.]|nr:hypothetical protein [Hirschia sp.]MBF17936.1 hypothetical protein [Hirschia sp.]|tara:strand:- start:488 stop:700 length:213 start_codon:yes stop_codon:yes gene_type:complete